MNGISRCARFLAIFVALLLLGSACSREAGSANFPVSSGGKSGSEEIFSEIAPDNGTLARSVDNVNSHSEQEFEAIRDELSFWSEHDWTKITMGELFPASRGVVSATVHDIGRAVREKGGFWQGFSVDGESCLFDFADRPFKLSSETEIGPFFSMVAQLRQRVVYIPMDMGPHFLGPVRNSVHADHLIVQGRIETDAESLRNGAFSMRFLDGGGEWKAVSDFVVSVRGDFLAVFDVPAEAVSVYGEPTGLDGNPHRLDNEVSLAVFDETNNRAVTNKIDIQVRGNRFYTVFTLF